MPIEQLRPEIRRLVRRAWRPVVENEDGAARDSKLAGTAMLARGEEWPACKNCHQPLELFVQLALGTLPAELQGELGSGFLQLFYCVNDDPLCEVDCEAYVPWSESVLARRLDAANAVPARSRPANNAFPAQRIRGWEPVEDLPNWEEIGTLGVELDGDEETMLEQLELPRSGDKLAGWPLWVQGIEYPACPECQTPMRLVFQIDSNDHLPYMFGDVGCGHLTQCATHKDVLAFGWACG
jgi:uncharacterized protein YwqG